MRQISQFTVRARLAFSRPLRVSACAILVSVALFSPSRLYAQAEFRGFAGVHPGGFGPAGFHGGTVIVGSPFLGSPWGWGGYGWGGLGPWGYGFPGSFARTPGYGSPFGGMPVMGSTFNAGLPYDSGSYEPYMSLGFAASEAAHMRSEFYPAIVEPSREVIAAALDGSIQEGLRISLRVPTTDAMVYFDGVLMKQTGLSRIYRTPKLKAGRQYAFSLEVVWQVADGGKHTWKRSIDVRPGATMTVDVSKGK